MIIGVPKELDINKIKKEVEQFSTKNKLTTQEKEELTFILRSFCKYYNKMSESDTMFEQEDIIESFDGILETITETYNGTGMQTRANLFWKFIPSVDTMRKESAKAGKISKSTKYKKSTTNSTSSPHNPTPRKATSPPSYNSYGSCGSSSHSSYGYSGGGCGGGYGGSYGGHC